MLNAEPAYTLLCTDSSRSNIKITSLAEMYSDCNDTSSAFITGPHSPMVVEKNSYCQIFI